MTGDSFYVADDGSGFPAGDRESLFEMGYTTDETGTGLGMAIVLRIAQAHGRSVSVAGSEEGGPESISRASSARSERIRILNR